MAVPGWIYPVQPSGLDRFGVRTGQAGPSYGRLELCPIGRPKDTLITRIRSSLTSEGGFTLVELLTGLVLTTIVLSIAVVPMRRFWFAQSLDGATNEVVTQLREQQEDAVSEAHPRVFGVRFVPGSSDWTLLRYDPDPIPDSPGEPAVCTEQARTFNRGTFSAAVIVRSVNVTNDTTSQEYTTCANPGDKIIFFYARGTSTGGSVVLEEPTTGSQETVSVSIATGRVTRT